MACGGGHPDGILLPSLILASVISVAVALLPPTTAPSDALQYLHPNEDRDDVPSSYNQNADDAWRHDGGCREGVLACVRRDLAIDLDAILSGGDTFNVTSFLAVERMQDDSDGEVATPLQRRTAPGVLRRAGLPTLAATAIRLFQTHALVWKLWPGVLHLKVYNHPGEGMDAAVDFQPALAARTWGALAARRRITMALLPIMYKMGVGTTLLGVLTFIGVKTMFMVSILLVLALSSLFKHKLSGISYGSVAYVPHLQHLPQLPHLPQPPQKEVHLHVHTDPHRQAYGGWHRNEPIHDDSYPNYSSGYHGYKSGYQGYHPPSSYSNGESGYFDSDQSVYYRRTSPGNYINSRWDTPVGVSYSAGNTGYYT